MGRSDRQIEQSPLAGFQAYLAEGKLAYQYSPSAMQAVFFPRLVAPGSGATDLEWRIASGRGTVYAATTVHPRDGAPYNVSLIDCDEGFRLMSRVEGVAPDDVLVGQRVMATISSEDRDDGLPYVFHAVGAGS